MDKISQTTTWSVAEAKVKLSEVMRSARHQGPQRIGTKSPCIMMSEEEWLRLNGQKPILGDWLVSELSGIGELELPSREETERPSPFAG